MDRTTTICGIIIILLCGVSLVLLPRYIGYVVFNDEKKLIYEQLLKEKLDTLDPFLNQENRGNYWSYPEFYTVGNVQDNYEDVLIHYTYDYCYQVVIDHIRFHPSNTSIHFGPYQGMLDCGAGTLSNYKVIRFYKKNKTPYSVYVKSDDRVDLYEIRPFEDVLRDAQETYKNSLKENGPK